MQRSSLLKGDEVHRLVVDNIADLVALVDVTGIVLYASPAIEQKLGYPTEELTGEVLATLVHPGDLRRFTTAFALCVGAGRTPLGEFRVRHREGHWLRLDGALTPIAGDETELVLVTAREMTERVRAEREFAVNAAHELLTPLAAMRAAIEVLQSGAKEVPEDRDAFLDDLEREVHRLGRLAHALLVLARVQATGEAPRLHVVELSPLVEEVAESVRAGTDVAVDVVCSDGIAVLGERDLLERALANLAENAAAHTLHGSIVLAAQLGRDGLVEIEVRDTGSGMPPAARARAFERFYRTGARGEGFGLGLAIVREVVRVLDGSVELDSEPGVGTAVRLRLPAAVR
jgi:two-component system, OmpR family, phosphate regulon sensor histidine kinase PhoR